MQRGCEPDQVRSPSLYKYSSFSCRFPETGRASAKAFAKPARAGNVPSAGCRHASHAGDAFRRICLRRIFRRNPLHRALRAAGAACSHGLPLYQGNEAYRPFLIGTVTRRMRCIRPPCSILAAIRAPKSASCAASCASGRPAASGRTIEVSASKAAEAIHTEPVLPAGHQPRPERILIRACAVNRRSDHTRPPPWHARSLSAISARAVRRKPALREHHIVLPKRCACASGQRVDFLTRLAIYRASSATALPARAAVGLKYTAVILSAS